MARSLMKRALDKRAWNSSHHRKKNNKKANFIIRDEFMIKAKKAWYRARSVYKLLELQDKFDLITPNDKVIDVWCAPWSFLQAIRNIVREKPILGIDLKPVVPFSYPNVKTIVHDIFEQKTLKPRVKEVFWEEKVDVITSDIWPNTTGIKDVDQYASVELNLEICKFSDEFLKQGGHMILKVFKWSDFNDLLMACKKRFYNVSEYKPLACRESSFEVYLVCKQKKK